MKAIQWTGENTDEVVQFGTTKTGYHVVELPMVEGLPEPELWLSDFNGGGVIKVSDYVLLDEDEEYVVMTETQFKENFKTYRGGRGKYEAKINPIYEGIQWTDDNTEECLEFVGESGSLDKSGQVIIIMNMSGGSMARKGWYILKCDGSMFALDEENMNEIFVEVAE